MHEIFQFLPKFHIFHISFYPIFLPFFYKFGGGRGIAQKNHVYHNSMQIYFWKKNAWDFLIFTQIPPLSHQKCMGFSNFYPNSSSFPPLITQFSSFLSNSGEGGGFPKKNLVYHNCNPMQIYFWREYEWDFLILICNNHISNIHRFALGKP